MTLESDGAATGLAARRSFLCRLVIYVTPVLAALISLSLFYVARSMPGFSIHAAAGVLALVNAAIAVIGAAVGTAFLHGRRGLRVAGALAYGVLALLVYGLLTLGGLFVMNPL